MHKQDIEITISPSGEVSFTVKGVKGGGCIEETRFLEEAVGSVVEREKTSEFYEEAPAGSVQQWAGEDGQDD